MALLKPIEWTDQSTIRLLDQRMLPQREIWVECRDFPAVLASIRDMLIRGAPALGIAAAMGLALGAQELPGSSAEAFAAEFRSLGEAMGKTRPTARNLFWAIERMMRVVEEGHRLPIPRLKERLVQEALAIAEEDLHANLTLSEFGKALIPKGARILTHCNAGALATGGHGTALGVIRSAFAEGNPVLVYVDETRPYLQGSRLTTWELLKDRIPTILISDNMAGYFMAKGEIDLVLVGADRVAANGDTANKIGTYTLSVLCKAHQIPFYVAAPLSTFDTSKKSGAEIPIEHRSGEEVKCFQGVLVAPAEGRAANPAFDITPGENITSFITEKGILRPPYQETIRWALGSSSSGEEGPKEHGKGEAVSKEGEKTVEGSYPLRTWEKLIRLVPGIAGYQGRERVREADKLLRTTLANQITSYQGRVEEVKRALVERKDLRLLSSLDLLTRRMAQSRDTLTFSSYGYTGVFDLTHIGDAELERIYQFDLSLAERIGKLGVAVEALSSKSSKSEALPAAIQELDNALKDFMTTLAERSQAPRG